MQTDSKFKVVIVGGGIAGLTLANSLQHAGIDFTLVERRPRLDPEEGASIGILPNGARVLDQIGCYSDLERLTVSMDTSATRRQDGSLIGEISDTLKLMELRTGYPVIFLDRRLVLKVLADHILERDRIMLNKSVETIEQLPDKMVVRCTDGTSVVGDIVVGADGVNSPVRHEMWRQADRGGQGGRFHNDKRAISAEYKCLFGISRRIPGLDPGQTDRTYAKNMSTLSYVGREGRVFWFVFMKMDRVYYSPCIPKYTEDDVASVINEIGSLPIRKHGKITVSVLHSSRVACNLVAIEEAEYQHWSYGRIVCVGDSIHKMTPNLGAGASSAIESAAVLSNRIAHLAFASQPITASSICKTFLDYQNDRRIRVTRAMRFSNNLTRVQALKGFKEFAYTHYIAPRVDDFAAEMFSSFVIGAPIIDHLPVPTRSKQGSMPFNPKQGWGFEEPKVERIKRAFPLVVLGFFCLMYSPEKHSSLIETIKALYKSENPASLILNDSVLSIHSDVMYGIWLLEAARLNNKCSLIQFPLIFGVALQRLGISVVAPLYLFLLYVQSPIENFRASDNRLTDISYTSTVGPLLVFFGALKYCLQFRCFQVGFISTWPRILQLQPYILSVSQFLLAQYILPNAVRHDRLWAVQRDVPWIFFSIGTLATASTVSWVYSVFHATSIRTLAYSVEFCDLLPFALGVVIWLALVLRDLREAGMANMSWTNFCLQSVVTIILLGPGSMLAIGWLFRENIILNRRHQGAIIKKNKT